MLERDAEALADLEPALARSGGKRIVEVKPRGAPDKGSAIARLLERVHGPGWPDRCAAIFLGDDLTDEDGFRMLEAAGAGVRVLDGAPFDSRARFYADGVDDAIALLEALAAIS